MSQTPGWERPSDDSSGSDTGQPPYPGWSTRQPPEPGWTAPGQPPEREPPSAGATPAPSGPGWGQQPPPVAPAAAGWGWAPPAAVKPGVIPLRPLGVGEILDGAVTTIRRNPGPMLGLSAIVAVLTQLLGLGVGYLLLRGAPALESLEPTASAGEVFEAVAGLLGASAIVAVVTWVATVVLTGILTIVVSRAVLGERLTAGQAWQAARRRLPRLLLLTLIYSLIWLAPFLTLTVVAIALGVGGADGGATVALVVLLSLAAIPVTIWLYVRYALSGPSLMLESTAPAAGQPSRPVGVAGALRRSAELVKGSWWRVFGILLLVLLIVAIISQVISVPFSLPFFAIGDEPSDGEFLFTLVLTALGGIVASTITAPFTAAATVLLYVDRRIRREGLDIDLARAAGVTIPGRTDAGPPPPPHAGAP
ncbi:MAG TPA: hypothetical protein VFR13_10290 [Jiangellaceae bacterium]|nr:hypothetical protein [Jiangellaceae bacterium]